jgi:hypothetical protein
MQTPNIVGRRQWQNLFALSAALLVVAACNDVRSPSADANAQEADTTNPDTAIATDVGDDSDGEDASSEDATVTADVSEASNCNPLSDECAIGEYCQLEEDALLCVPETDVVPDPGNNNPPCPSGRCSRGGICMPSDGGFGAAFICYQPCDPTQDWGETGCFNSRHTCWPAEDSTGEPLPFGLCAY